MYHATDSLTWCKWYKYSSFLKLFYSSPLSLKIKFEKLESKNIFTVSSSLLAMTENSLQILSSFLNRKPKIVNIVSLNYRFWQKKHLYYTNWFWVTFLKIPWFFPTFPKELYAYIIALLLYCSFQICMENKIKSFLLGKISKSKNTIKTSLKKH